MLFLEEDNNIYANIWKQVCGRFNRTIKRYIIINKIGRLELYGRTVILGGTTADRAAKLKIKDTDGRIATLRLTVTYTGKEE